MPPHPYLQPQRLLLFDFSSPPCEKFPRTGPRSVGSSVEFRIQRLVFSLLSVSEADVRCSYHRWIAGKVIMNDSGANIWVSWSRGATQTAACKQSHTNLVQSSVSQSAEPSTAQPLTTNQRTCWPSLTPSPPPNPPKFHLPRRLPATSPTFTWPQGQNPATCHYLARIETTWVSCCPSLPPPGQWQAILESPPSLWKLL